MKIIFSLFFSDNWIFFLFPLLLCACLSVLDVRVFLAVLMLLMVSMPFVMFLLYSYYMLTDSMVWSVTDKSVKLSDDGKLLMTFENPKIPPVSISKAEVKRVICYKKHVLLQVENRKYRLLIFSEKALGEEFGKTRFVQALQ
ncbi:MAG: hypothetical protein ACI30R_06155 [Sodaliphilus sp.]